MIARILLVIAILFMGLTNFVYRSDEYYELEERNTIVMEAQPLISEEQWIIQDALAEFDAIAARIDVSAIGAAVREFNEIYRNATPVTYEVYYQTYDRELSDDPQSVEFLGEFATLELANKCGDDFLLVNAALLSAKYSGTGSIIEGGIVLMQSDGQFIEEFMWEI